jgi:hypothetical protein
MGTHRVSEALPASVIMPSNITKHIPVGSLHPDNFSVHRTTEDHPSLRNMRLSSEGASSYVSIGDVQATDYRTFASDVLNSLTS